MNFMSCVVGIKGRSGEIYQEDIGGCGNFFGSLCVFSNLDIEISNIFRNSP